MSPGNPPSRVPDPAFRGDGDPLVDYFRSGEKAPGNLGIGIEYERIGILASDLRPVPYEGPSSISALLENLSRDHGWNPIREGEHLIGLERSNSRISLEPGGQIELSGRVHDDLFSLDREVRQYQEQLRQVSEPLGILWMAIGLHPFSRLSEIPWIPKQRYRILSRHLARRGDLAHDMMKKTAGVQINLDYVSEADAMEKFRAAMGLTSLVTALFANSPFSENHSNGFMSRRAHIWTRTDPDRCGLLRFAFDPDASYRTYTEHALAVPSLWLVRDGRWHPTGGVPFGRLLENGWRGRPLTPEDWVLHLTSLFPEVRLKKFLEIRSGDSVPLPLAMAFAALWKGILYDPRARREAWELVQNLTWEQRLGLHAAVCRDALRARAGRVPVRVLAERMLEIAGAGLERQTPAEGRSERPFLDPALDLVAEEGTSPARRLMHRWNRGNRIDRPQELATFLAEDDPRDP